jgi:heterodisulfide reductase subunit A2
MAELRADAVVIGGGIAGMQSALDLADQGFQVALIEREPSIGGKMITLSKVFPTLDCCSCITTPKMSSVAHHPNIRLMTYCELETVQPQGTGFRVSVRQKPRYVDMAKCTGCRECEYVCPITVPSLFDRNLGAYRAIRIPFSTAVPQKAVLDPEYCLWCGKCEMACLTSAIDFSQTEMDIQIEVGAVIMATGFDLTPLETKSEYGAGKLANVIDPLMMERFLAPTGPYGRVLRPGDGKEPSSIAYVQCAGSRDETLGITYCSRVCCMYSIKQAMLLNGALPLADITIYYMDIRTFGKGYEQFYQNAKAMGVEFVRGKVASIKEDTGQNPIVRVEMTDTGEITERTHDLVVLAQGIIPAAAQQWRATGKKAGSTTGIPDRNDRFLSIPAPNAEPCNTETAGVFAAGTAMGPMDIVDSIISASAAASAAGSYLRAQASLQTAHASSPEAIHA